MFRHFLTTILFAAVVSAAQAQPVFQDVKFTHGPFGPERSPAVFHSRDEVWMHYSVTGLQTDAEDRIDVATEYKLIDPMGTVAFRTSQPAKTDLLLGGGTVSGVFNVPLDIPYLPEGEWTVEITITDNVAKRSTTQALKWTHKPREFAFVRMAFARDDQFKVPAQLTAAVVGQPIFLRNKLVGYVRDHGKLEIDVEMVIMDAEGREVMKPRQFPGRHQLEGDPSPMESWDFNGNFVPNRPGQFTIRFTAHDRIGDKTATVEVPLHVENP
jgi:hypothetical protein